MNQDILNQFSNHLFWDVDKAHLNLSQHKTQIIFKVVEFGFLSDWELIKKLYSKEEIVEVVTNLRTLDKRTHSYLSLVLNIDKTKFRCYSQQQSSPNFWNY